MDIAKLLTEKKLKITTAESCTGGLIAKLLTDISGASNFFDIGFVTYSNDAKIKMLGVKPKTLESFGAVSAETAREMCEGALKKSDADIAVSVTGIAGPTGGSGQKPVGLVYIGICGSRGTAAEKFLFKGARDEIRNAAARKALQTAYDYIVQSDD